MKHRVAIIGKGNIGWAIKELLKNDYDIKQGDITDGFDARDIEQVRVFLKDVDAVISAGPFAINKNIGAVAAELNIKGDYIFVHDTSSEGQYDIQIDSPLQQIKPRKLECEDSIFDWLGVIENAKEVHCIDSSFIHMIDSYSFSNKKVYHNIRMALSKSGVGFTLRQNWMRANYG